MIRSFDLLDLPTLHRYRHEGLFLDSALALTWGTTLVPAGALLSYLAPATGIFTCLSHEDGKGARPMLAQLTHTASSPHARLSFIAPESALDSAALQELMEYMAAQVGERGGHNLLAEVDESTQIYEALRRAGFAIYARQRIWKVEDWPKEGERVKGWRSVVSREEIAVRSLYNALVPALVQQVEPPPWDRLRGMIYRHEGDVLAYAGLTYGPRGIIVQPFFHPDVEDITPKVVALLDNLPNRLTRSVHVRVRSYQSWLESALEEVGAQPGPRQAVMVKRLVVPIQEPAQSPLTAITGTRANPTVPFTRSIHRTAPPSKPVSPASGVPASATENGA
jgi:hypothetical protein